MRKNLLDIINSLGGNMIFEVNHNNNSLSGQIDGQFFECYADDYDPKTRKLKSDIKIRINDAVISITSECDSKVIEAETSTEMLEEEVSNKWNTTYTKSNGNWYSLEYGAKYQYISPSPRKTEDFSEEEQNKVGANRIVDMYNILGTIHPEKTMINGNLDYIKNAYIPQFFEADFLSKMVSSEIITQYDVQLLKNNGFVYSKRIGQDAQDIEKTGRNNPMSTLSYTAVYSSKRDFEQGANPLFIEADTFTTNQNEVRKFTKTIYALNKKTNKYQNISDIAYQYVLDTYNCPPLIDKKSFSPLEFELMMEYISQLNMSLSPSTEFQKCYQIDSVIEQLQPNLNQIRFKMNLLKFQKYNQEQLDEYCARLEKEFGKNELQDTGKSM